MSSSVKKRCIGIVGGMGPAAGILLQQLILEATPAMRDQDHIQVLCFTDPTIPDRTEALKNGDTRDVVASIAVVANRLVGAGATELVIPCNTAHAFFGSIQDAVTVPIYNIPLQTIRELARLGASRVGLLATDGTILSGVYDSVASQAGITIIKPTEADQKMVMNAIYQIKAGDIQPSLADILHVCLKMSPDVSSILLGCTELSLLYASLVTRYRVIDPLRICARDLAKDE